MTVNVLILEDNPVTRTFLCRVVRESFSNEMIIVEASELDQARRQIAKAAKSDDGSDPQPFKLIFVDLELADGAGLDLLAELTHDPALKIGTTLYADDEHLFPALQCGADGYLLKEDRFEVAVEELQRIVRGQPPLSPALARRMRAFFRGKSSAGAAGSESGFTSSGFGTSQPVPLADGTPSTGPLTAHENDVLTYLSKGFTIKEIAKLTGMTWIAVSEHIRSLYKKINGSSRSDTLEG